MRNKRHGSNFSQSCWKTACVLINTTSSHIVDHGTFEWTMVHLNGPWYIQMYHGLELNFDQDLKTHGFMSIKFWMEHTFDKFC